MAQGKERPTIQRRGSSTSFDRLRMRAALGLGQPHDIQFDAVLACGCGWVLSGVALIDEGDIHAVVGGRLHGLGHMCDLGAVISVGGRDVHGQEIAERVHRHVPLRAWLALGPVVTGPLTALGRRPQRWAVEDGR